MLLSLAERMVNFAHLKTKSTRLFLACHNKGGGNKKKKKKRHEKQKIKTH